MEQAPQFSSSSDRYKERNKSDTSIEAIRESSTEIIGQLEHLPDYEEFTDATALYRALPSETLVVRREDPVALLHTLVEQEPLPISFVGDTPYANSVVWNPRVDGTHGLDNAFLEGYGHANSVVTIYGFKKPEQFKLEQLQESMQRFAGIDRTRVRSASGLVPAEAIRFVLVRTPIQGFPEDRMTEEEKDRLWEFKNENPKHTPSFVYRGFLSKEKAADLPMAA
ncbi:MAG: hypothetical protein AAB883_00495 [Patescibacteria group bacterium]